METSYILSPNRVFHVNNRYGSGAGHVNLTNVRLPGGYLGVEIRSGNHDAIPIIKSYVLYPVLSEKRSSENMLQDFNNSMMPVRTLKGLKDIMHEMNIEVEKGAALQTNEVVGQLQAAPDAPKFSFYISVKQIKRMMQASKSFDDAYS